MGSGEGNGRGKGRREEVEGTGGVKKVEEGGEEK